MVKGSVHQKDLAVLNVCALNNRATKYMNQKLVELKGERQIHVYSLRLSIIDSTTRQEI